jgi:hypothetical protein
LIYGWDNDTCDPSSENEKTTTTMVRGDEFYAPDEESCTTTGSLVAESLSYDPHRVGSLARLAVAFSPPERALQLDQIEKIDVLCVERDRIFLRAIICEDGGCVSLSVPVVFPQACNDENDDRSMLEGCVINHLEQLDQSLPELFRTQSALADLHDTTNSGVTLPSWWVDPSGSMAVECATMRDILNEVDFAPEITALAQTSLDTYHDPSSSLHHHHQVDVVKVAAVGPAGLWFRVKTKKNADEAGVVLDVLYPFGGPPVETIDALRATVLGLVATA